MLGGFASLPGRTGQWLLFNRHPQSPYRGPVPGAAALGGQVGPPPHCQGTSCCFADGEGGWVRDDCLQIPLPRGWFSNLLGQQRPTVHCRRRGWGRVSRELREGPQPALEPSDSQRGRSACLLRVTRFPLQREAELKKSDRRGARGEGSPRDLGSRAQLWPSTVDELRALPGLRFLY